MAAAARTIYEGGGGWGGGSFYEGCEILIVTPPNLMSLVSIIYVKSLHRYVAHFVENNSFFFFVKKKQGIIMN
jgi:hypothetical protein